MRRINLCSGDGVCVVEVSATTIKRLSHLTDFGLPSMILESCGHIITSRGWT